MCQQQAGRCPRITVFGLGRHAHRAREELWFGLAAGWQEKAARDAQENARRDSPGRRLGVAPGQTQPFEQLLGWLVVRIKGKRLLCRRSGLLPAPGQ